MVVFGVEDSGHVGGACSGLGLVLQFSFTVLVVGLIERGFGGRSLSDYKNKKKETEKFLPLLWKYKESFDFK